ncbi:nucleoside 2-deoxyribosyltransferase domain-containing protein (plasmid) [Saccharopolyspora sp. ID03-671]|uniref:nucleoside 2-deoxyribosyltransferase domain-containing protein n=1 Tax=Saccharopolyspora sp. ID03-671 TaxID=3073066 RepID=UPI00325059F5
MAYIEAPHYHRPTCTDGPTVFLAGGITGVERWHTQAAEALQAHGVTVFNPNRADFPIHDPNAGWEQVSWEQHYLHAADVTLMWFPASDRTVTTQPIAMFELGQALGEGRRIVVGADANYPREPDVRMLCQLNRSGMPVFSTLADTLAATVAAVTAG